MLDDRKKESSVGFPCCGYSLHGQHGLEARTMYLASLVLTMAIITNR